MSIMTSESCVLLKERQQTIVQSFTNRSLPFLESPSLSINLPKLCFEIVNTVRSEGPILRLTLLLHYLLISVEPFLGKLALQGVLKFTLLFKMVECDRDFPFNTKSRAGEPDVQRSSFHHRLSPGLQLLPKRWFLLLC